LTRQLPVAKPAPVMHGFGDMRSEHAFNAAEIGDAATMR